MSSFAFVPLVAAPVQSSPDPHSHNLRDRSNRKVWTDLDERGMPTRRSPLWKPEKTSRRALVKPNKFKPKENLPKKSKKSRSHRVRQPSSSPVATYRVGVPVHPSLVDLQTRASLLSDIKSLQDLGKEWLQVLTAWHAEDGSKMRMFALRVMTVAGDLAKKADDGVRERQEATVARAVRKERYDSATRLKTRALHAWEGIHNIAFVAPAVSDPIPAGDFYSHDELLETSSDSEADAAGPSGSRYSNMYQEAQHREEEEESLENGDFSDGDSDEAAEDEELTARLLESS
ncbi:hypothetical protein P7C70_g4041, partial [Phenoliferia sp. Uapishka_3]